MFGDGDEGFYSPKRLGLIDSAFSSQPAWVFWLGWLRRIQGKIVHFCMPLIAQAALTGSPPPLSGSQRISAPLLRNTAPCAAVRSPCKVPDYAPTETRSAETKAPPTPCTVSLHPHLQAGGLDFPR